MRLSAQEEYGLRCLLQVARSVDPEPIQITEVARREGLSPEYTAKLLRVLRQGGLIRSVRGAGGGYMLARPADEISVYQAIEVLGGAMFDDGFCGTHSGRGDVCVHSTACSIRSLWRWVGTTLETVLDDISLANLARGQVTMPTGFASEGAPQ
jgi:Rrf2 family protein